MKNTYEVIKNEKTGTYRIWNRVDERWVGQSPHTSAYETRWRFLANGLANELEKQWRDVMMQSTWNELKPTNEKTMSDDSIFTYSATDIRIIDYPKSQWTMTIRGDITFEFVHAPNRFHRFMQRLVLGFKWEKIEQKTK